MANNSDDYVDLISENKRSSDEGLVILNNYINT